LESEESVSLPLLNQSGFLVLDSGSLEFPGKRDGIVVVNESKRGKRYQSN
jgi:hypothetical protein